MHWTCEIDEDNRECRVYDAHSLIACVGNISMSENEKLVLGQRICDLHNLDIEVGSDEPHGSANIGRDAETNVSRKERSDDGTA